MDNGLKVQNQQQMIVMQQPVAGSSGGRAGGLATQNQRMWTTGMCGCFEDCCTCFYACCFSECFMCTLATELGECPTGPFFFGRVFTVAMRTKVRTMYGIRGSICRDICAIFCCSFCTTLQMHRELKNHGLATL